MRGLLPAAAVAAWFMAASAGAHAADAIAIPLKHEQRSEGLLFKTLQHRFAGEIERRGKTYRLEFRGYENAGLLGRDSNAASILITEFVSAVAGDEGIYDSWSLPDKLALDNTLYDVSLDLKKPALLLTPCADATGTMKPTQRPVSLAMRSDSSGACLVIALDVQDGVPLPAGTWRLDGYVLRASDSEGDLWVLSANGSRKTTPVKIQAGEDAQLVIGEPYSPVAYVLAREQYAVSHGARQVSVSFDLIGAGNELVSDVAHVKGSATTIPLSKSSRLRPREPQFKAFTEDDKLVVEGSFEYG